MKLENQVCSLELAKRLKELGVKQDTLFYWQPFWSMNKDKADLDHRIITVKEVEPRPDLEETMEPYSAFTVAELGEMLPKNENIVMMLFENGHAQVAIQGDINIGEEFATKWGAASQCIEADTEADARARMLIYLLENNLITL